MTLRLLVTVLLTGALALPVSAQRTIRVVGADDQPIPDVRIDVFGLAELLGVFSTSGQGIAELSSDRWSEVRRISLSHIGFQTLIVQADDIPADGVIRLEPAATRIEGVLVEVAELCPIADEERARRLWAEVASRYATDTGYRAWLAYLSVYGGAVRQDELYRTHDTEPVRYVAAGGPEVPAGTDPVRRTVDDRISTDGYAWPPLSIGSSREVAWDYPELDREDAYHFASPVFGTLHDFAVRTETEGRTSLVFCGNDKAKGATINGIITLVPEDSFLAAEWRFQTTNPDEGAGGSVSFASSSEGPGMKPHLVAAQGLFYRHDGTELRYPSLPRTYTRYGTTAAHWYLLSSGNRPCNTGLSFHGDPPPPTNPDAIRFAACVAEHWGRE